MAFLNSSFNLFSGKHRHKLHVIVLSPKIALHYDTTNYYLLHQYPVPTVQSYEDFGWVVWKW